MSDQVLARAYGLEATRGEFGHYWLNFAGDDRHLAGRVLVQGLYTDVEYATATGEGTYRLHRLPLNRSTGDVVADLDKAMRQVAAKHRHLARG